MMNCGACKDLMLNRGMENLLLKNLVLDWGSKNLMLENLVLDRGSEDLVLENLMLNRGVKYLLLENRGLKYLLMVNRGLKNLMADRSSKNLMLNSNWSWSSNVLRLKSNFSELGDVLNNRLRLCNDFSDRSSNLMNNRCRSVSDLSWSSYNTLNRWCINLLLNNLLINRLGNGNRGRNGNWSGHRGCINWGSVRNSLNQTANWSSANWYCLNSLNLLNLLNLNCWWAICILVSWNLIISGCQSGWAEKGRGSSRCRRNSQRQNKNAERIHHKMVLIAAPEK